MGVKKRGVQGGHPPIGAQPRHCERSEAIHSAASGEVDCFAALATTAGRAFAISLRAPKVCWIASRPREREMVGTALTRLCPPYGDAEPARVPLSISKRVDRIEPRGAPRWIERREE